MGSEIAGAVIRRYISEINSNGNIKSIWKLKCSLFYDFICSLKIRSLNRDIFKAGFKSFFLINPYSSQPPPKAKPLTAAIIGFLFSATLVQ